MADIAELIVALRLQDGVSGGLGNLNRTLTQTQTGLAQVGRGVGQVGSGLSRMATVGAVAAVGGLTAVITTAASFEQAFTGVEKTVEATEAQFRELEQTIRGMARTGLGTFEDLAAIGEAGGALGIARESLDEFIDVVARLGVSTNLSTEQAATALGQLANVLHLDGEEMEQFADSLVALGNAGASTEAQIVEMAARFGAAGNAAGLSKEEILALSSAVASMGVEVEAGGSALSRIFNNITTDIGTGAESIAAFTRTMGISAREFRTRWESDALGTFEEFLGKLAELDQFEVANVLSEAGITNVRDINAVQLMTQNLGFFSEQLRVAENAQGALRLESDKFLDTTAGKWFTFKQNARDALATVGTELLPLANEQLETFIEHLSRASTQQGIKDFATDLASGVKALMTELRGTDFSGIIGGMKLAADAAKGAFNMFRSLPPEIQAIAVGAFALNKVTGGALGSIAGGLGQIALGTLKLSRGDTPANPMFVSAIGGIGGAPVAGGRGTGALGLLGAASVGVAGGIGAAESNMQFSNAAVLTIAREAIASNDPAKMREVLRQINSTLGSPLGQMASFLNAGGVGTALTQAQTQLVAAVNALPSRTGAVNAPGLAAGLATAQGTLGRLGISNERLNALVAQSTTQTSNLTALNARTEALKAIGNTSIARLLGIETKNWSPTINVTPTINTNVNIDGAQILRATSRLRITTNSGGI